MTFVPPPHRAVPPRLAAAATLVLAVFLVFPSTAIPALAAEEAGVRLLHSDRTGVALEVALPEPTFEPVQARNRLYHRLDLDGYAYGGAEGEPLLPERTLWIAVPEGATVSLSAEASDTRFYEGMRLVPQQRLDESGRGPNPLASGMPSGNLPVALVENPASYGRSGFGDDPIASLDGVSYLRDQRVARVTVRPAAFDPPSGRVRVEGRIRIAVSFSGGRESEAPIGTTGARDGLAGARIAPDDGTAGGPFERIYRELLVNYESGRLWRRRLGERGASSTAGLTGLGARQDFSSSPNWVRVSVTTKGIHRINASDLTAAGVSVSSIDPRTLRLFVRPGLPLLPEEAPPSGWLSEVGIRVVGDTDGTFDASDYLLFYGLGVSGWKDDYLSPGEAEGFLDNPYETRNTYWLTWGGGFEQPVRRWTTRSGAPELAGAIDVDRSPAREHMELDIEYWPNLQEGGPNHAQTGVFWEKWVWQTVKDADGTVSYTKDLPGAVTTEPARILARLWGNSSEVCQPDGSNCPTPGIYDHYLDVTFNDVPFTERRFYGRVRQDYDSTATWIRDVGNRLTVKARRVDDPRNILRSDRMAFVFWELYYTRRLQPVNNTIEFQSPDTTGALGYALGPFGSLTGFTLLDTSDPLAPVEITNWVARDTLAGQFVVYFHDQASPRRYLAFTTANQRSVSGALARVTIDDLQSPANGADYVVITYDGFVDAANRLAALRDRKLPGFAAPRTRVVKISDVYAWYSGGRTDPTAIRNFIYDTVANARWAPAPSILCLLGDSSYDFKNILRFALPGQPAALVPGYVNAFATGQFLTDDWLVDLDLGALEPRPGSAGADSVVVNLPDLIVGRLPASTAADAAFMVDGKIQPYDENPTFGEWRTRGLLVADDLFQGFRVDVLGTTHMRQTEDLESRNIPVEVDRSKIYLVEYPYGSGPEKPAANRAVKAAVNEGVLFWNYFGHGSPSKIADENAFIISDVGDLTNLDHLTFLVAASCDLGKFDDPNILGLAEALIKSRRGGVVASLTASELAFAFANQILDSTFFSRIFTKFADGYSRGLGEAALLAKLRFNTSSNDNKYVLLGDPATRLGSPVWDVRYRLEDAESGEETGNVLTRGRRVRVFGEFHRSHVDSVNALDAGFEGNASILVTDAAPRDTIAVNATERFAYRSNSGVIYHGETPVRGGRFEASFIVPLEAITGDQARVRIYATNGQIDGVGASWQTVLAGTPAEVDTTGPTIDLRFVDGTLEVPPDALLRIVARDEHGINLTGHTIPNAFYLTIDGTSRYDLTESFRYDAGSYQQGSVEFRLPNLEPGPHTIVVSAADNYAQGVLGRKNRSTASIDFVVSEGSELALGRVYNFPNPFRPATGTTFVLSGISALADVQVKIHTVSGSLVRTLTGTGGPGQVQLVWDGRDERGDRVANGAYLYQVTARTQDGSGRTSRLRGQAAALE